MVETLSGARVIDSVDVSPPPLKSLAEEIELQRSKSVLARTMLNAMSEGARLDLDGFMFAATLGEPEKYRRQSVAVSYTHLRAHED